MVYDCQMWTKAEQKQLFCCSLIVRVREGEKIRCRSSSYNGDASKNSLEDNTSRCNNILTGSTFFFWSLTAWEKLLSSLSRFILSFFCFFLWNERKNKATTLVTLFPEAFDEEEEAFLSFKCRLWRRGQLLLILIRSFLHGRIILWFKC
ncbi:unnamed protein product [Thlaspi arvense]|uniref:Uncharacterized protein n=1 Tax=Thlaspi arvense TaxID=13288 RepID=A0AAU9S8D4_THLAR|nr:unnamed protein product [Thlaspi arvense]